MKSENLDASGAELDTASETHLVALAQLGDEAAFRTLFEAHKRRVYSLCLRMTRSTADAEDLTQEAFLSVFRNIGSFRGDSTFSTWLYRLAVNQVLMHLRKKRSQPVFLNEVESVHEVPSRREYAREDAMLAGAADRIILSKAVGELSRGYRAVFLLHDVEGYHHREIAQLMNWSVGSSKSQLNRARRKLRDWFRLNTRNAFSANPNDAGEVAT